jgi:hypothetical protein
MVKMPKSFGGYKLTPGTAKILWAMFNKPLTNAGINQDKWNDNKSKIPSTIPVRGPALPTRALKASKGQELETFIVPRKIAKTTQAIADRLVSSFITSDLGSYFLPGSFFVSQGEKLNLASVKGTLQLMANNPVLVAVLLAVREASADIIPDMEETIASNTLSIEEIVEGEFPAGDHDIKILTPFQISNPGTLSGTYYHTFSFQYDITNICQKLETEYWNANLEIERKYDLHLLVFCPYVSTTITGDVSQIFTGKIVRNYNRMI